MYKLEFSSQAVKDLKKIPFKIVKAINQKLVELAENPTSTNQVKKMALKGNYFRLRVGDYRALFILENETKTILVVSVKHRKDIYKNIGKYK